MSLRALQERRSKEMGASKTDAEPHLVQNDLADSKDQNDSASTKDGDGAIIAALREQLQIAETTLTNTISKNEIIEKQLDQERRNCQDLTFKLRGKEELLRNAQAVRSADLSTSSREQKLQEHVLKLKSENANLKSITERLQNQLQVEKAENAGRLPFMASSMEKNRDDDEDFQSVMPSATPYSRESSAFARLGGPQGTPKLKAASTFKFPTSHDELLKLDSMAQKRMTDTSMVREESFQFKKPEKKRKRNLQEEIDEELPELQLDDFKAPTAPRQRKRIPEALSSNEFHFKAICGYDGDDIDYMPPEAVKRCEFLQERISKTKNVWENNRGEDWLFDFTKTDYKCVAPPCVTMKMAGRKTRWRSCGVGLYACRDCVRNGRPCFTWVKTQKASPNSVSQWSTWEFRLLPVHEEDRARPVVKGKTEVRYWLNDGTKFQDSDVLKEADGDDEYVD